MKTAMPNAHFLHEITPSASVLVTDPKSLKVELTIRQRLEVAPAANTDRVTSSGPATQVLP
jgi:hypothetical protein